MTEEDIIKAAVNYANNLEDVKPTNDFNRNLCIALGQSFRDGAKWAYTQALKEIWHNVKDEKPELRRTVICVNELVVEAELYTDDSELDEIEHYTKWCYLDDILPNE